MKKEEQLKKAIDKATEKGGECLSTEYNGVRGKLIWKCSNPGHEQWESAFTNIVNKDCWCPKCYRESQKNTSGLEIAKSIAESKGGQCLSDLYVNSHTKMKWKCSNPEHPIWEASFNSINRMKSWCPYCSGTMFNENGLKTAKQHAESKGGLCLSTEYINAKSKLLWKCNNSEHHPFESVYYSVIYNKQWCPECAKELRKSKRKLIDGLKRANDFAESKGGKCLSTEYINSTSKLEFKCSNPEHHSWKARYKNIANGHWCPECGKKNNLCERKTRLFFEMFIGKKFPTRKPDWNINPDTNDLLELDGYCEVFKIAFEHDGEHHFQMTRRNQLKAFTLPYQKFKDHQKKKNCQRQGITLINIPIIEEKNRNNFQAFLSHVIKHCQAQGLPMSFTDQQLLELEDRFNKI